MKMLGPINSGIAIGENNAATSNESTSTLAVGRVIGIYLRYNDSCPAGTNIVISTAGTLPEIPSQTILSISEDNTDGLFMPRIVPCGVDGVDLATLAIAEPVVVSDFINVLINSANSGDSIDAWFFLE